MDMLPRHNRLCGEADDLAVAHHRFADGNGLHRNLVARGNAFSRRNALRHLRTGQQSRPRDHHGVVGVKTDYGCGGHSGLLRTIFSFVMAGLVPAIHVLFYDS